MSWNNFDNGNELKTHQIAINCIWWRSVRPGSAHLDRSPRHCCRFDRRSCCPRCDRTPRCAPSPRTRTWIFKFKANMKMRKGRFYKSGLHNREGKINTWSRFRVRALYSLLRVCRAPPCTWSPGPRTSGPCGRGGRRSGCPPGPGGNTRRRSHSRRIRQHWPSHSLREVKLLENSSCHNNSSINYAII